MEKTLNMKLVKKIYLSHTVLSFWEGLELEGRGDNERWPRQRDEGQVIVGIPLTLQINQSLGMR